MYEICQNVIVHIVYNKILLYTVLDLFCVFILRPPKLVKEIIWDNLRNLKVVLLPKTNNIWPSSKPINQLCVHLHVSSTRLTQLVDHNTK